MTANMGVWRTQPSQTSFTDSQAVISDGQSRVGPRLRDIIPILVHDENPGVPVYNEETVFRGLRANGLTHPDVPRQTAPFLCE